MLVRDTSTRPDIYFYQVSSKYSKGYSSYRADKKFYAAADADAIGCFPKTICSPPFGRGVGRGGGGGERRRA